jgi:hypothetical protein
MGEKGRSQVSRASLAPIRCWRDANNDERLDGENGLLLMPNADHLFDRGFISFEDNGGPHQIRSSAAPFPPTPLFHDHLAEQDYQQPELVS